jgi:hypothetical protein
MLTRRNLPFYKPPSAYSGNRCNTDFYKKPLHQKLILTLLSNFLYIVSSVALGSLTSKHCSSCEGGLCPIAYRRRNYRIADGKPHREGYGTAPVPLLHHTPLQRE